jgi:hypothetical protein
MSPECVRAIFTSCIMPKKKMPFCRIFNAGYKRYREYRPKILQGYLHPQGLWDHQIYLKSEGVELKISLLCVTQAIIMLHNQRTRKLCSLFSLTFFEKKCSFVLIASTTFPWRVTFKLLSEIFHQINKEFQMSFPILIFQLWEHEIFIFSFMSKNINISSYKSHILLMTCPSSALEHWTDMVYHYVQHPYFLARIWTVWFKPLDLIKFTSFTTVLVTWSVFRTE